MLPFLTSLLKTWRYFPKEIIVFWSSRQHCLFPRLRALWAKSMQWLYNSSGGFKACANSITEQLRWSEGALFIRLAMGGYGKGEHSECALSSCWHAESLTCPEESRKNSWSMRIIFPLTTLPPLLLQGPGQASKIQEALKSLAFLPVTSRGFGSGPVFKGGKTCKTEIESWKFPCAV